MSYHGKDPKFNSTIIDDSENGAVAAPAAGSTKLINRFGSFYSKDSAGNEVPLGSSSSGEINLITSSSTAGSEWVASNVNVTVATTTTATDLPLAGIIDTAIKITRLSGSDYVRYRFSMPESLRNTKLKLSWYQLPLSGYASGDCTVDVYTNTASNYSGSYVRLALSTDSSSVTSIPNAEGQFLTNYYSDSSIYYEIRINALAGTTALNIANVVSGPGLTQQGGIVTPWESYTPTFTGFGTVSPSNVEWMRSGSNLMIRGDFTIGTPTATQARVSLPPNLTVGGVSSSIQKVGDLARDAVSGLIYNALAVKTQTYFTIAFVSDNSTAENVLAPANGDVLGASGNRFSINNISIPIAEWAGSGTVNLGQNDVEYAASTNGTWDAAASAANTIYGPAGVPVGGALGAARTKTVRFQTPVQATDEVVLELFAGGKWVDAGNLAPYSRESALTYGALVYGNGSANTDVDVFFGRYVYSSSGGYATAGDAWNSIATAWRVKKTRAGVAVGFGQVSGTASGLMPANLANLDDVAATRMGLKSYSHGTTYNGGNAPTISGLSGLAVQQSSFIPYQMQDGSWRLKFNIEMTFTSGTTVDFSVNGLVFSANNAVVVYAGGANQGPRASTNAGLGSFTVRYTTASTAAFISGDVSLASKPTWAY